MRRSLLWRCAGKAIDLSQRFASLSDDELLARGETLRWRARSGTPLKRLLVEAFALVRDAARRTVGLSHFPVQMLGGAALFHGYVTEMQTGEGKTITAVLPAFLRGLTGRGCHVVTVNDYLARRDAETMGPIYQQLGLSVGCIQTEMSDEQRRRAYQCDVTYGTAKELGFDFLRDRLRSDNSTGPRRLHSSDNGNLATVQRGHHFALVDEADSVFIDEARTPLIIGIPRVNTAHQTGLIRWSQRAAKRLDPSIHYIYEPERRTVQLTEEGCRFVLLTPKPSLLDSISAEEFYDHIEQTLTAEHIFARDRDYVVADDEVVIVDESTGRMMKGRKWQEGLHQAVEAKEGLPITPATVQAARVTVQRYFRQYTHLAGMTGTAVPARRELSNAYGMKVMAIPTHRPCIRRSQPPRVFATMESKHQAIVAAVVGLREAGRAVLIGTPSVTASERLSRTLNASGISHVVLNARQHEAEAEIVAQAGQPGRVTIATNMAGRGTDIVLAESVRAGGGLHVIATEMHSSARIDRQLAGRAARQGDPGSFQFLLSLDDELLRTLPEGKRDRLKGKARPATTGELPAHWIGVFRNAQRHLERMHHKQRRQLLRHEEKHTERFEKMGLDPFTELAEAD